MARFRDCLKTMLGANAGRSVAATLAVATTVCASPLPSPATESTATLSTCSAHANTTYAMVECNKTELARVDARLATAYAKTLAALPSDQQTKLKQSEQMWVAFRKADCGVFYGTSTGTIASVQGGACMISRANRRIADLAEFTEK